MCSCCFSTYFAHIAFIVQKLVSNLSLPHGTLYYNCILHNLYQRSATCSGIASNGTKVPPPPRMICLQRLVAAATTKPEPYHVVPIVCGLLAIEGCCLVPLGRKMKFLSPFSSPKCNLSLAKRTAGSFFIPAVFEEAFWRAMLLPNPVVDGVLSLKTVLPQCLLFGGIHLLSHPVAGRTLWRRGHGVFDDKRYAGETEKLPHEFAITLSVPATDSLHWQVSSLQVRSLPINAFPSPAIL